MMKKKSIGSILRELRGNKSRAEVAKAVGVSTSAIAMYELDERIPRDDVKVRIAHYYGKPVATIFFANEVHDMRD